MEKPSLTMAQQVAEAAAAFEKQRTGHAPQAVTVVLGDETLVITLHGALSPAERALAQTPEGAAQVQDFHRQLFNDSADGCGRRSNESRVSRCEKSRRRSKRRPAPWCRCLPPAPWCRCSCSPVAYPRRPGTERDLSNRHEHGGSCMLVLSRKRLESVVVGGAVGFERLLKVTVLDLSGGSVRLGFEVDSSVPVHRWEVWEKIRGGGRTRRSSGGSRGACGLKWN